MMALFEFTKAAKTGDDVRSMKLCAGKRHLSSSLRLLETEKMRSDSDSLLNRSGPACGADGAQHMAADGWEATRRRRSVGGDSTVDDHRRSGDASDQVIRLIWWCGWSGDWRRLSWFRRWSSWDAFEFSTKSSRLRCTALRDAGDARVICWRLASAEILKMPKILKTLKIVRERSARLVNGFQQGRKRFCLNKRNSFWLNKVFNQTLSRAIENCLVMVRT